MRVKQIWAWGFRTCVYAKGMSSIQEISLANFDMRENTGRICVRRRRELGPQVALCLLWDG